VKRAAGERNQKLLRDRSQRVAGEKRKIPKKGTSRIVLSGPSGSRAQSRNELGGREGEGDFEDGRLKATSMSIKAIGQFPLLDFQEILGP